MVHAPVIESAIYDGTILMPPKPRAEEGRTSRLASACSYVGTGRGHPLSPSYTMTAALRSEQPRLSARSGGDIDSLFNDLAGFGNCCSIRLSSRGKLFAEPWLRFGSPPFRRKLQQRMSKPRAPTLARGPWRRAPPPLAPAAGAGECAPAGKEQGPSAREYWRECEGVEPSGRSRPCRRPPRDRRRYCATSRCARSADPTGATSEQRPPSLTAGYAVGREDHPPAVGDQTRAPRPGARSNDPLGSAPLQRRQDRGGVPEDSKLASPARAQRPARGPRGGGDALVGPE